MKKSFFVCLLALNAVAFSHQNTDTLVMISPDDFKFNYQTGTTNSFQHDLEQENIAIDAQCDFERIQTALKQQGIRLVTLASRKDVSTPDAVFPNNWFSVHAENNKVSLVLYPMLNANRQAERQIDALCDALATIGISIDEIIDLTSFESEGKALEGTGSLVLDRVNKFAYASLSPRTCLCALNDFATRMGYQPVTFLSTDESGYPIYHTNVVMSVGSDFAVLCKECIAEGAEMVVQSLIDSKKEIIYITSSQLKKMCGNILEVQGQDGRPKIIMSDTAFGAFTKDQLALLSQFGDIVHANIQTIETVGGGSARCMLAEVFY